MPKNARELPAIAVSRIKTPGLHMVGGVPGLGLQVGTIGSRSWILRHSVDGRRRDMGLGGDPAVSLAEARQAAHEARSKVRQG